MITVTYDDHMGSDLSVVNKARVSFGKKSEWEYGEDGTHYLSYKDAKLIKYLAEHKHFAPFGHSFASFHIKAPIFVARQLVKHKFLRWSEISRRYIDDEPEFYTPEVWRGRSEDKKQGSSGVISEYTEVWDIYGDSERISDAMRYYKDAAREFYKELLHRGVAPEQARMVLPQSTMTEWFWSGSLDALADMCKLRCKEDTQYETQLVADQISEKMKQLFPVSWVALVGEQT
jgi:thymidylate synthase (FAD)